MVRLVRKIRGLCETVLHVEQAHDEFDRTRVNDRLRRIEAIGQQETWAGYPPEPTPRATKSVRFYSPYSHSMVPGGFEVTSQTTRLMPRASLMMRVAVRPRNSCGNGK
jgi:hypothetical protein